MLSVLPSKLCKVQDIVCDSLSFDGNQEDEVLVK